MYTEIKAHRRTTKNEARYKHQQINFSSAEATEKPIVYPVLQDDHGNTADITDF